MYDCSETDVNLYSLVRLNYPEEVRKDIPPQQNFYFYILSFTSVRTRAVLLCSNDNVSVLSLRHNSHRRRVGTVFPGKKIGCSVYTWMINPHYNIMLRTGVFRSRLYPSYEPRVWYVCKVHGWSSRSRAVNNNIGGGPGTARLHREIDSEIHALMRGERLYRRQSGRFQPRPRR